MSDVRVGEGWDGSGAQEGAETKAKAPVVVFGGAPEPALHDEMPLLPGIPPGNTVALTFDDGPDNWTDAILDILEEHNVPATFFVVGEKVKTRIRQTQRIVSSGSEIANHTFSHANLDRLSNEEILTELADCSAAIHTATGHTPYFYRAPFLNDPPAAKMAGLTLGMFSVDCDIVAHDWEIDEYRVITNIVTRGVLKGGRIVLLHDGVPKDRPGNRTPTVKAVRSLVPWLIDRGYELVTVSQLLGRVNVPAEVC